jgi:hypothetical protein
VANTDLHSDEQPFVGFEALFRSLPQKAALALRVERTVDGDARDGRRQRNVVSTDESERHSRRRQRKDVSNG